MFSLVLDSVITLGVLFTLFLFCWFLLRICRALLSFYKKFRLIESLLAFLSLPVIILFAVQFSFIWATLFLSNLIDWGGLDSFIELNMGFTKSVLFILKFSVGSLLLSFQIFLFKRLFFDSYTKEQVRFFNAEFF